MKLVILAGGQGSRMGEIGVPKPMLKIAGRPILELQVELARRYNLTEIIISTGYKGDVIENYFGDGHGFGANIRYHREKAPLGTAGALKEVEDQLRDDFLVFYGDTVIGMDLESFMTFHFGRNPIASIVVHPNDHPYDSDLVEVNDDNIVTAFHNKPRDRGKYFRNCVNAALYLLSPKIFSYIQKGIYSDFAKDIFPKLLEAGESIYAYNTAEYIKDVGTPARIIEVERDLTSGKVDRLSMRNKRRAIFLDRDGVLNIQKDPLKTAEEMVLLPGVADAVKAINKSEYLAVVVTNQPLIAKGFITEAELARIHAKLETMLGMGQAYLDRIYYCPHHPEKGFEGEVKEYKIECDCRKPKVGLINRAVSELNIDISNSFIIGDRTVDVMTGKNAGLKTILLRTGWAGADNKFPCEPDFVFENLKEATDFILSSYGKSINQEGNI